MKYLFIDLFCGGGGVTTGAENARDKRGRRIAKVIAAVNHDPLAIASHAANHKDVLHLTEDIRNLRNIGILRQHIIKMQAIYPGAKLVLWASLECTNFSNAKNGPRERDSRTLAWDFYHYVKALKPDIVMIENVREFMAWGEVDDNGKPISRDKGRDYIRWVKAMQKLGYNFDWQLLNAANYGVPQTRTRYFAIFAKPGIHISWPKQTHAQSTKGFFNDLRTWKPVRDVLELHLIGNDIFDRKKALSENTLRRIYAGLQKFVAAGDQTWIVKYFNRGDGTPNSGISIDSPCATITVQQRINLAFVVKNNSGHDASKCVPLSSPTGTITTKGHQSLVQAAFIQKYYNGSDGVSSMNDPAGTITTRDRLAAVWIDKQYGTGVPISTDQPAGTVVGNDKHKLVTAQFLSNPQYSNIGRAIDRPAPTVIARQDKQPLGLITASFITQQQYDNRPYDVSEPAPTVVASRRALNVVHTHTCIELPVIEDSDSFYTKKIKAFMQQHGIIRIYMRGLNVQELLRIQDFPDTYILKGSQEKQKKFIGNAVPPTIPKLMLQEIAAVNSSTC